MEQTGQCTQHTRYSCHFFNSNTTLPTPLTLQTPTTLINTIPTTTPLTLPDQKCRRAANGTNGGRHAEHALLLQQEEGLLEAQRLCAVRATTGGEGFGGVEGVGCIWGF